MQYSKQNNMPVACLIRKSLSSTNINKKIKKEIGGVERFDAIKTL